MKVISYYGNGSYFLTDKEFASALSEWNSGRSCHSERLGVLLPPPKGPVGTVPEHADLDLMFTWKGEGIPGLPGWIGVQRPVKRPDGSELKRGAVYVREVDHNAEGLRYVWREVNVENPHKIGDTSPDVTSEDVRAFIGPLEPVPIDEILSDPELRRAVPLNQLLPESLLN